MNFLSVCSGIDAASVAWEPLGMRCIGLSEIAAFPRAVLQHHYPQVDLFGDFTEIQRDDLAATADILVGGTPCQSFSVAGLRGGMDDDRGNLALEFCRLARRTRARWITWENVPGVLSSYSGPQPPGDLAAGQQWRSEETSDFGSFLAGLAECGYGFAYRILDAQFVRVESHAFAVPQRRRRLFVVGYLGCWRRPAAVLSERESMCRHPPPRRKTGKNITGTLSSRTRGGGTLGTDFEIDGGLVTGPLRTTPYADSVSHESQLVVPPLKADGFDASEDGTGRGTPLVSHCLNAGAMGRIDYETETMVAYGFEHRNRGDDGRGYDRPASFSREVGATIGTAKPACVAKAGVRRLTPRECERLQGFPDDYTLVPYRGKPTADGPRYKALGNSMAVNVMSWIGQRIQLVDTLFPVSKFPLESPN